MPELIEATVVLKSGVPNTFHCSTVDYESARISWKRYAEYHPSDVVVELDDYVDGEVVGTVSVITSQIAALSYERITPVDLDAGSNRVVSDHLAEEL